jgi:hypothetical protein
MKPYLISGVALALLAGTALLGGAVHAQAVGPGGPGGPGAPSGPGAAGAPPKAPPGKAAHFILQDGDAMVDVKCGDEESMKTCADITMQILDKLVTLPKH